MSCGVRYQFSLVTKVQSARLLASRDEHSPEDKMFCASGDVVRRDSRRAPDAADAEAPAPRGRTGA